MYAERTVKGAWSDGLHIWGQDVTVRITKDATGETLSLSDEKGLMLLVPLEPLRDLIEVKKK